jgi:hypothetical protein
MRTTMRPSAPVDVTGREEWLAATEHLLRDAEAWATDRGWQTERFEIAVEDGSEKYAAPGLSILTGSGRLHLEPVSHQVIGAKGRVDLLTWPTLIRVSLLYRARRQGPEWEWTAQLDSGVDWPHPWSRETFYTLADTLLRSA